MNENETSGPGHYFQNDASMLEPGNAYPEGFKESDLVPGPLKKERKKREPKAKLEAVVKTDGGGLRFDTGKPPLELIPPEMLFAHAEVSAFGSTKYQVRNWERGMSYSKCFACALRHLFYWWMGEDRDKESGLHHLHHALWNVAALVTYLTTYPEGDDRPRKGVK